MLKGSADIKTDQCWCSAAFSPHVGTSGILVPVRLPGITLLFNTGTQFFSPGFWFWFCATLFDVYTSSPPVQLNESFQRSQISPPPPACLSSSSPVFIIVCVLHLCSARINQPSRFPFSSQLPNKLMWSLRLHIVYVRHLPPVHIHSSHHKFTFTQSFLCFFPSSAQIRFDIYFPSLTFTLILAALTSSSVLW